MDGEAFDGAISRLCVAGATELIDDSADHEDARPRARRRARGKRAPLFAHRVPDLRALERSECLVARRHATDEDDSAVRKLRGACGETRFPQRPREAEL